MCICTYMHSRFVRTAPASTRSPQGIEPGTRVEIHLHTALHTAHCTLHMTHDTQHSAIHPAMHTSTYWAAVHCYTLPPAAPSEARSPGSASAPRCPA